MGIPKPYTLKPKRELVLGHVCPEGFCLGIVLSEPDALEKDTWGFPLGRCSFDLGFRGLGFRVEFEYMSRLGLGLWCRDIVSESRTLRMTPFLRGQGRDLHSTP